MRLAIAAGFFAAIGLFAVGPASAAYATVESPDPSPSVVTEEPSEEALATEISCPIVSTTDDDVTIEFDHPEALEDLTVTVDEDLKVKFDKIDDTSIAVARPESDVEALIEGQSVDSQQEAYCTVTLPGITETPQPTESETPEEAEPTEEPESTADPETSEPTPTDPSPPPTTPEPPATSAPTSPPSPSPSTVAPTEPSSPTITPSTPTIPQPPIASAPPTRYAPPPTSAPSPSSTATTPSSEDLNATDTERRGPREIRPLAESPRYLLPQLLGTQSHRGSPLVMPAPRDADERASELETLPPISEDELDAIKAQLSAPGHADQTPTGTHVEGAPQDPDPALGSWWLLGGLTSAVGIGAVIWWALGRRRRDH